MFGEAWPSTSAGSYFKKHPEVVPWAEIYDLRQSTDVELQTLDRGRHIVAVKVQRLLHELGIDQASVAHSSMVVCNIAS